MTSTSLHAVLRSAVIPRNVVGVRTLHASPSVFRKSRSSRQAPTEEAIDEDDLDSDFDLFDNTTSQSASSTHTLDRGYVRKSNLSAIYEKASRKNSKGRLSPQSLRQVVATSTEAEEVEELKRAVRAWRIAGERVSKKTGEEIVGRCVNLGRADVAAELVSDRIQYGLPNLDQPILIKLHHALLSSSSPLPTLPPSQPISPTLALLRLNLLQSQSSEAEGASSSASPEEEASRLATSLKARRWKSTATVEGWAEAAKSKLVAAGGAWADAVKSIEARRS